MTTSHNTSKSTTARRRRVAIATLAAVAGVSGIGAATAAAASPQISFSAQPNPVVIGGSLTATLAGSYDPDGTIVEWEYDLNGDGIYERRVHSTTNRPQTITVAGPSRLLTVRGRVTDNSGNTTTASRVVRIHARPVALLTADRPVPTVGDVVGYRATGSYDPDPGGSIVNYAWDLDGNGTYERSTGASPYVTTSFATPGNARVGVRVTDRDGATGDAAVQVRVNGRPTAVIAATPNPPVAGQPVTLSGSNSRDDRGIASYAWDLDGNGSFETNGGASPTTTTTFASPGMHRVGLRVTDTDGATDDSAVQLNVGTAPQRDTKAPHMTITPTRVRVHGRTATVTLACPADELFCRVRAQLIGRSGALNRHLLSRATTIVPGGERQKLTFRLGPRTLRVLRRTHRVSATVLATASDAAGNTGLSGKRVTLVR